MDDKEHQKIKKDLSKYLGPEMISNRPGGASGQLSYIEGWTIINIANKIFGYNNWSSKIKKMKIDFCENENYRFSAGVSCVMKVKLKCGASREDIGYGLCENGRSKGQALEKARKEAATDALKRTLRQFGNAMGNCLYDKNYLKNVKSIKKEVSQEIDKKNLLRRSDTKKSTNLSSIDLNSKDFI